MSAEQLVMRLLCGEARVDSHKVRTGYLSKEDWNSLARAMSRLAQARIFIDDTPGISIVEMRSKGRRLMAEHGLDRKSTRLNSSHVKISYAVFCLKKKKK